MPFLDTFDDSDHDFERPENLTALAASVARFYDDLTDDDSVSTHDTVRVTADHLATIFTCVASVVRRKDVIELLVYEEDDDDNIAKAAEILLDAAAAVAADAVATPELPCRRRRQNKVVIVFRVSGICEAMRRYCSPVAGCTDGIERRVARSVQPAAFRPHPETSSGTGRRVRDRLDRGGCPVVPGEFLRRRSLLLRLSRAHRDDVLEDLADWVRRLRSVFGDGARRSRRVAPRRAGARARVRRCRCCWAWRTRRPRCRIGSERTKHAGRHRYEKISARLTDYRLYRSILLYSDTYSGAPAASSSILARTRGAPLPYVFFTSSKPTA